MLKMKSKHYRPDREARNANMLGIMNRDDGSDSDARAAAGRPGPGTAAAGPVGEVQQCHDAPSAGGHGTGDARPGPCCHPSESSLRVSGSESA
jgi:hypothetical protein